MIMGESSNLTSDMTQKIAQVVALTRAAESGAPFCEKCEAARAAKKADEELAKRKYHRAQFQAIDERTGEVIPDLPYQITVANGAIYRGTTDDDGKTAIVTTVEPEDAEVEWLALDERSTIHSGHDDGGCC